MRNLFLERDAVISPCGRYRYLLRRTWDHYKPRALFVMLNPSTADAETDDATIRSCARLLRALNYGSFEVVNLFSWRATHPKDLEKAEAPIGPNHMPVLDAAVARCDIPICAWGGHRIVGAQGVAMALHIRSMRPATFCFGLTKGGDPKHPLYIKTGTPLVVYRP